MPRLIAAFMRHGDYQQRIKTPSALQPYGLTPEGCQQAQQGAAMLIRYCQQESLSIHPVIDSSTLLRAWQTASEISSLLSDETSQKLSVKSDEALCERSVGSVANLTTVDIENLIAADPRFTSPEKNWKSDSHYCLPFQGAESLMDSGQRVAAHIQQCLIQIKSQLTQDTLKVFVGHGASFRHAAYILQILEFSQISQLSMFHVQPVFLEFSDNLSFKHIAGKWKIRDKKAQYKD